MEYFVEKKFHDSTYCTGGILSRYDAGIDGASERLILSQMFVEAVCFRGVHPYLPQDSIPIICLTIQFDSVMHHDSSHLIFFVN